MKGTLKAAEQPKTDRKPGRCHINLGLITIDPFLPQQRAFKTGGFSAACYVTTQYRDSAIPPQNRYLERLEFRSETQKSVAAMLRNTQ